jgi:dethiobiotin synthetase
MRGLFVTGTDTGVGKTLVTAALARLLRRRGEAVRVCKPVATGAERDGDGWVSEDTRRLAEAAGEERLDLITPWAFPEPAAPPVAARLAGRSLELPQLTAAVRRTAADGALLLVEGVGGLCCPLTEQATVADLAHELGLPLLVVARRSLGSLNHTLLTLEVAAGRGLGVAGVVVSAATPVRGVAEETFVDELRPRLRVPLLAVLPYCADEALAVGALAEVDWRRLTGGA